MLRTQSQRKAFRMTLEAIYYISQIVASVAVLASLIYLALQTRQTAKNQQAQMHAMRVQLIRDDSARIGDPVFGPIWRAGLLADPDMDDASIGQFQQFAYGMLLNMQEQYHEYLEGMINNRRWQPTVRTLEMYLSAPGFRATFHGRRQTLDVEFAAFVDKLIAGKKGTQRTHFRLEQWRSLAAAERNGDHADASKSATSSTESAP